MMRRLIIQICCLLAAAGLVAGCTGSPSDQTSGATPSRPSTSAAQPSDKQLQAARKAAGIADCPKVSARSTVSKGLPDVTLDCLGSNRTVPLTGLRGKPMVINIWAQWCPPCRAEAPHIASVAKDSGQKVDFLGIDYADPDPEAAVAFADAAGWRYPQLQDRSQQVKGPLKIIGVPQTFLVDADGTIVYRQIRPVTSDAQLRSLIHDHLGVTV